MRIIDKLTDYYDYTNLIYFKDSGYTFDRRGSVNITDEDLMFMLPEWRGSLYLVVQIGFRYLLFERKDLKRDSKTAYTDKLELELIADFVDYGKPGTTISIYTVEPDRSYMGRLQWSDRTHPERFSKWMIDGMRCGWFKVHARIEDTPIIGKTQIPKFINQMGVCVALEEYFAKQEEAKERTESIGITNTEKIINHGFDKKKSFRGK